MIEYKKEGRIAVITINRPEAYGALTVKGQEELNAAFNDIRDDDEVLAGIITGSGDKAFCTGVDIKDMLPYIQKTAIKQWQQPPTIMHGMDIWKPMIAAINGMALGGGLEIALACDIRIATDTAKFGLPEVKVGMFSGAGGTQRLARLIPPGIAAEMIYTGRTIDSQEAFRIGLINRIVPLDKLMPTALDIAGAICQNGPLAVRTAKECLVRGMNMGLDEGLKLEVIMTPQVVFSEDFQEGMKAFAEKRKPNFKGK
jgi:enoyl-CoA hydratase/carnithine racemase